MTKKLLLLMICAGNVAYMSAMDTMVQEKVSDREEELETCVAELRAELVEKDKEISKLTAKLEKANYDPCSDLPGPWNLEPPRNQKPCNLQPPCPGY